MILSLPALASEPAPPRNMMPSEPDLPNQNRQLPSLQTIYQSSSPPPPPPPALPSTSTSEPLPPQQRFSHFLEESAYVSRQLPPLRPTYAPYWQPPLLSSIGTSRPPDEPQYEQASKRPRLDGPPFQAYSEREQHNLWQEQGQGVRGNPETSDHSIRASPAGVHEHHRQQHPLEGSPYDQRMRPYVRPPPPPHDVATQRPIHTSQEDHRYPMYNHPHPQSDTPQPRESHSAMMVSSLLSDFAAPAQRDGQQADYQTVPPVKGETPPTPSFSKGNPGVSPEADSDGKPFRCEVPGCDKRYKKLNGLIYHNQTAHSTTGLNELKPFKCTVDGCDKAYRNSNGLAYHLEKGHGPRVDPKESKMPRTAKASAEKPYSCPYKGCGKAYKNPNGLAYHLSKGKSTGHSVEVDTQNGMRVYICAVAGCRKTYKSPQGLGEHIEVAHADMPPITFTTLDPAPSSRAVECPSCMRTFRSASSLDEHILNVHHSATPAVTVDVAREAARNRSRLQGRQGFDARHPHHADHYTTYHTYYEREEAADEDDDRPSVDEPASGDEKHVFDGSSFRSYES
ncbi:hypothetical protein BC832DRAFT_548258 [Gaertneriomyces semiglobifer]|nr:hypothetical protein BC832DRAFT_548258 [Gaertneriomyces semiglobifer]